MRLICVDEQMPVRSKRVLAYDNGGFGWLTARFTDKGWYLEGWLDSHCNVTHWMELPPEPPTK